MDDPTEDQPHREEILVTGFPSYTAARLGRELLEQEPDCTLHFLVEETALVRAREFANSLPEEQASRVRPILGRVDAMDLGLSGDEFQTLRDTITSVQHLAGAYDLSNSRQRLEQVNVTGTKNVLEFAHEARHLRRLCHWSTAFVSGKRRGVILEEELDEGQSFHNVWEETKFTAEMAARQAQRHLPVTVLRPSIIVGDTQSGEIGEYDGPYHLIGALAQKGDGVAPLPASHHAPCHIVPIDYVVESAVQLWADERAAGRTFHLTDPNPLPTRIVLAMVASESRETHRSRLPPAIARALRRTPGFERLTRSLRPLLDSLSEGCFYNCRSTLAFLRGTDIDCPALDSYVEQLVLFSRAPSSARAPTEDDTFDPFE